jgi:CDP-diacylglycerol--glycerol-3-phosphate 3-phosphatidyltransferase
MTDWASRSRQDRRGRSSGKLHAPYLAATSLSFLKPLFKRALWPVVGRLARSGVTANQVTVSSMLGSFAVGVTLAVDGAEQPSLYALLPIWLLIRMALATIDGTLAHDFGQKSRLGGILNELGDVLSDIALYMPLAFIVPFSPPWLSLIVVLAVGTELIGMAGPWLGASRRCEGPFGKSDRTLAFGAIGAWLSVCGSLPAAAGFLMPVFAILLIATIANRLRFAMAEAKTKNKERTQGGDSLSSSE